MLTSVLGQRQDPTAWNVAIIQSTSTATESRRGCEEKESEGQTKLSGGDILPATMRRKTTCLASPVAPMRHVSRIVLHNQSVLDCRVRPQGQRTAEQVCRAVCRDTSSDGKGNRGSSACAVSGIL